MSKPAEDNKEFTCYWGDGYNNATTANPIVEVHGMDFFTEDRCYDKADIKAIGKLAVGKVWRAEENQVHIVVRKQ